MFKRERQISFLEYVGESSVVNYHGLEPITEIVNTFHVLIRQQNRIIHIKDETLAKYIIKKINEKELGVDTVANTLTLTMTPQNGYWTATI